MCVHMRCVCVCVSLGMLRCHCVSVLGDTFSMRFYALDVCVFVSAHIHTHTRTGYIKTVPGHWLFNSSCQPSDGLLVSTTTVPALPFDLAWCHSGLTRSRPLSPSLCRSLLSKQKRGHCHHRNDNTHPKPPPSLKLCRLLFMLHALT